MRRAAYGRETKGVERREGGVRVVRDFTILSHALNINFFYHFSTTIKLLQTVVMMILVTMRGGKKRRRRTGEEALSPSCALCPCQLLSQPLLVCWIG
jgi:hypothetical protein